MDNTIVQVRTHTQKNEALYIIEELEKLNPTLHLVKVFITDFMVELHVPDGTEIADINFGHLIDVITQNYSLKIKRNNLILQHLRSVKLREKVGM